MTKKPMIRKLWLKLGLLVLTCTGIFVSETFAYAQADSSIQQLKQARFTSLMIRDMPPSVEEAKGLFAGRTTLESLIDQWLSSEAHQERMQRYFNDRFGLRLESFIIPEDYVLQRDVDHGAYYSRTKGRCAADQVVTASAWWHAEGASDLFCSELVNPSLRSNPPAAAPVPCSDLGDPNFGFASASCGCGPNMLFCLPTELRADLRNAVRYEFSQRGAYGYQQDWSWNELLGGRSFYGNRLLYYYYLMNGYVLPYNQLPSAEELTTLASLSVSSPSLATLPASGPERAGVATSPAFLKQNNNFRSRVRALTYTLLCQDVDGSLNTDGIATFVNPTLEQEDVQHGTQESCSSCHFPMDNMGSMLLGWSDQGIFQQWENYSQLGHSFGLEATGPKALIDSFVDRAPGFHLCMAKTAWEDLAGLRWSSITPVEQSQLMTASESGPRSLIAAVFASPTFLNLRQPSPAGSTTSAQAGDTAADPNASSTSSTDSTGSTSGSGIAQIDFTNTINPIIRESCGGTDCHAADTALGPQQYGFVDNEATFRAVPINRLQDGSMPPDGSGLYISEEDLQVLIEFLQQAQ